MENDEIGNGPHGLSVEPDSSHDAQSQGNTADGATDLENAPAPDEELGDDIDALGGDKEISLPAFSVAVKILNEVLETLGTQEMEVQDREGRWHLLRVRPYRTSDNKIEGLVVVLVDIDQLRRSQEHLMDARDFARSVVESVPVPILVLNEDLAIRTANTAFRALTQLPGKDLEERSMPELFSLLWGVDGIRERFDHLLRSANGTAIEFEHQSTTAQKKTLLIKAQALWTEGSRVLLLMIEDITARREAEILTSKQKEALESEIAAAARRLTRTQEELRGLTAHLFTMQEEERQHVARELHDDISQRLSHLEILLHEIE